MQLSSQIHLVGSGKMGLRLTHDLDCNVYLLDGGNEALLIDAGGGVEPERIATQIEKSGIDLNALSTLLLTHTHGDHAAGARFWHDTFGLQVYCAAEAKPWMETGDTQKNSLRPAIEAGIYPADYQFASCPIAQGLFDGDEVACGDITLQVVETPGHARGHLSFFLQENQRRALFGGDLIFAGGKISLLNTWDSSIQEYSASMQKLFDLQADQLFPGHGPALLSGADEDIERAHRRFQNLGIPRTIN